MSSDEQLDFLKKIIDVVRGKENVRNRLSAILDPAKPETSTKLSSNQVDFVICAKFFNKEYPALYKPLDDLSNYVITDSMSLDGWGVDEAIKLAAAIEQSQAYKALYGTINNDETAKKGFLHMPSFRKPDTKQ